MAEEVRFPISFHGELPGFSALDAEQAFLNELVWLHAQYPKLKMVMEHLTTATAAIQVMSMPSNVAATITPHHLVLTLDDVVGNGICPHNYCKPIAKTGGDRQALITYATSGNDKFFLGTDSAPHPPRKKESVRGAAGIFNAPVALAILAQVFESVDKLYRLPKFVGEWGAEFYGLPRNEERVELVREPWTVSAQYSGIVPFMAGQTLDWQLKAD